MAISFACPECRVQIEVADEHAGQTGQCPRCRLVITIPSPHKSQPVMTAAEVEPPTEAWTPPRTRSRPRRGEEEESRPRRSRPAPAPRKPMGPIWPWALGVFGAIIVASLLFSSLMVLIFWRRAEPTRPPEPLAIKPPLQQAQGHNVTVGWLEGRRAMMQDGVFQIRSQLTLADPFDLDHVNSRAKIFDVTFLANRDYVIELDSKHFDGELRLEDGNGPIFTDRGDRFGRTARIHDRPQLNQNLFVHVTSPNGGLGEFTLTIRESHRPKPFVP